MFICCFTNIIKASLCVHQMHFLSLQDYIKFIFIEEQKKIKVFNALHERFIIACYFWKYFYIKKIVRDSIYVIII